MEKAIIDLTKSKEENIKEYAKSLGFDLVGIAEAKTNEMDREVLQEREKLGYRCSFEEKDIDKRVELDRVLPGCKSAIMVAMAYSQSDEISPNDDKDGVRGKLSKYCRGIDYHTILREKTRMLADWIKEIFSESEVHPFVDTDPMIDRSLAQQAGIGFFGRSNNLITRDFGTWVFIGGVLTNLELIPDKPGTGTCGHCTACKDFCPSGAIIGPNIFNANRCISYITQMRGYIPKDLRKPMGLMVFGCDICQEVCPHNRRKGVMSGNHSELKALPEVGGDRGPLLEDLIKLSNSEFKEIWQKTAAGWRGKTVLQRNAVIALGNSGDPRAFVVLTEALKDQKPIIRGHAAWALGRLVEQCLDLKEEVLSTLQNALIFEKDLDARSEIDDSINFIMTL